MAESQAPGCRDAALATGLLLGFAIVLFGVGLTLINQDECTGVCETLGLAALYAGGPISALFGIATDSVVVAWPLDITFWVVAGFLVARWAQNRPRRPLSTALVIVVLSLVYGLVLSQFVELNV